MISRTLCILFCEVFAGDVHLVHLCVWKMNHARYIKLTQICFHIELIAETNMTGYVMI
jgi:hypothetical protein